MPLFQTAIARPEWVAAQNPADWLAETELITLNAWRSPRRRAEWLAGRLAVKRLLQESLGVAPHTCTIGRMGLAPYIAGLERPEIVVSLSHSAGFGAATFSHLEENGSVGIDAQQVRPVHPGLCARVFSLLERQQIAGRFGAVDSAEGMLLFWALKEAAIKARRAAWGRPLQSLAVTLTGAGRASIALGSGPALSADYEWVDGWWLARAVLPPPLSTI